MAQTELRPARHNNVTGIIPVTADFFAASWLLLHFASPSGHVSIWHGFGLALACLLSFGMPLWPGVALGIFLAGLAGGMSVTTCIAISLGSALGALAGSFLLIRLQFDVRLERFKDYLALVLIGAILAPGVGASIEVLILFLSGNLPSQALRHAWIQDWMANSLGALTIVPATLLWLYRKNFFLPARLWLELTLLTGLIVFSGCVVFLGWQSELFGEYVHVYVFLPLLIWAALDFGRRITAIGILLIFSIATISIQQNVGMFALDHATAFNNLWLFVTTCSISGMTPAMVLHELQIAKKSLRESEANIRSLAESSSALIWLSDTTQKYIWFNHAWLEFTGRTVDQEIGDGWREGMHEDDAERCQAIYTDAFVAHRPFEMEYRLRHHSGRYRTIVDHGAPRFDEKGHFLGYTGTCWDITTRREAEEALVERERVLRAIYDNSNVAIGFLSPNGRISHANQRMADMFGFTLEELVGTNYADHIHPEQRELVHLKLATLTKNQNDQDYVERLYQRKDGSKFWGHLSSRQLLDDEGHLVGVVGVITDITERKSADTQLRLAAQVFDNSHEGIVITDAEDRMVSVNQAFTKITGYTAEEALGQSTIMMRSGQHSESFYIELRQRLEDTGHWDGEATSLHKDGRIFPVWLSISVVRNERGEIDNYICIFTDITERKATEDRIRHLAQYDFLTDLPNRALLFDRLTREFFEARRYDKRFAILFIDLDKFKPVNDQYGHAVGDLLLREVAKRLSGNVRDSDTVSRQGGDEFIILVPELPESEQVVQLGLKLLRILDEPYLIDGHTLHVTPSIGVAIYPDDGEDVDTLMKNADTAMYRAKNAGRNNLQCYGVELNALARSLPS